MEIKKANSVPDYFIQNLEVANYDYELSCHFAQQLEECKTNERALLRQSFSDLADREPKFLERFPNLWTEICNDIANIPIEQPLTKPVIMAAGCTLDTALRYLRCRDAV